MTCRPLVTFETTNISKLNELNQTATDLRKLVMGKMINNPKTFSGATGKNEEVGKWLEEVETQFDNGDIQDSSKLAIISYHLKSEALVWYRENRKNITTWDEFVKKITKAFKSSHHSELAYRKLETYTQTGTQSIRNYYSEMIQIFREADPCMSDHEKLRYLFKNMKGSLQYEVRKAFPKTPSQFLENALEIEDLLKLSNQATPSSTTTTVMATSANNNPAVATFVSDDENPRNLFYKNNSQQNNQRNSFQPRFQQYNNNRSSFHPRFSSNNSRFSHGNNYYNPRFHQSSNYSSARFHESNNYNDQQQQFQQNNF
ncbi:unnamed protein product, partial [Didymodactylos carnosus]